MASPQIEDGHIDIANTIVDKFCSYRLSGQEWQVLWVVIRKTWGWLEDPTKKNGRKKKMDTIALSQFAELTGINRRKCHALLKSMIDKCILKKVVTQKGDTLSISYGINKDFDTWKVSPKKVTVPKKGDRVSPKKATGVSPKKAHTKETLKETIQKTPPELCEFVAGFIKYICDNRGKLAPKNTDILFEKSLDTVDKLIRIDGFNLDYIRDVTRWAVEDDFWSTNFFSLASLRKKSDNGATKFANMASKYDKQKSNTHNNNTDSKERLSRWLSR